MDSKESNKNLEGLGSAEDRLQAWVNNRMAMILMYIEYHRDRPQIKLNQIDFFLDSIAHHFVDCHSPQTVWSAFRYLRCYFHHYPTTASKHDIKAVEMVVRIYEALGIDFCYDRRANGAIAVNEIIERGLNHG